MADAEPRLYLNSYGPLVMTKAGRFASEQFSLPPFIDGSIRREPDFEHDYPSISCLCRAGKFAPRLCHGDIVVYVTKKGRYGTKQPHRRLTAILRVLHLFDRHSDAATWYRNKGLHLPNNCLVRGNRPNPVSKSHRYNEYRHLKDDRQFTRCWDLAYQARAREHGRFVVCEPLRISLGWDAPVVHDQDLKKAFGRVPATLNPGPLNFSQMRSLLKRLRIDVRL